MAEAFFFPAASLTAAVSLKRLVENYERRLIIEALERVGGNQRRAALELGVLPTTLNEKMRRLGLRACDRSGGDLGDTGGISGVPGPAPRAGGDPVR